jgi:hypothetical protein
LAESSLSRLGANCELINLGVLGFYCGLDDSRPSLGVFGALFGVTKFGLQRLHSLFIFAGLPGFEAVSDQPNNYQRGDDDECPSDHLAAVVLKIVLDSK